MQNRVEIFVVMAMICELDKFMEQLGGKLDSASCQPIKETLQVNGFTSRLQIKLISEKHLELMFIIRSCYS